MLKKRYAFTLIEVIIATSLFAVLIFSTTSLFFRYHKLSARLDSLRPKIFERTLFFEKMTEITNSAVRDSITTHSPIYEEYLSFTFDNGYKDDPEFSGPVTCEIYRNFEEEVIYSVKNQKGKERSRPLLQEIKHFHAGAQKNTLTLTLKSESEETAYTFLIPNTKGYLQ